MTTAALHTSGWAHEATLREFTSFLGATLFLDETSNDATDKPKTRLDHLLSSQDEWAARMKPKNLDFSPTTRASSTFPSLSLFPPKSPSAEELNCGAKDSSAAQQLAKTCIGRPIHYGYSEIANAPENMARAVASSFSTLVEANLRNFVKLRSKTVDVSGLSLSSFVGLLANKKLISIRKVSTSFTIPSKAITDFDPARCKDQQARDELSCQLPLHSLFVFDIIMNDKVEHVTVNSMGQITGRFDAVEPRQIDSVDVTLDYPGLLLSLRQKARLVAYKVITTCLAKAPGTGANITIMSPHAVVHRMVTPSSSPVLTILSEAAAALEPMKGLDLGNSKRDTSDCKSLPPKKRIRRAVSPTLLGKTKPMLTGFDVLSKIQS